MATEGRALNFQVTVLCNSKRMPALALGLTNRGVVEFRTAKQPNHSNV